MDKESLPFVLGLAAIIIIVMFFFASPLSSANYVEVRYRDGKVNIGHERFEDFDTSRSSFIRGAWYDADNQYMIINLSGTYYHYCGKPYSSWQSFMRASSLGVHYNQNIKGQYDCRIYDAPKY